MDFGLVDTLVSSTSAPSAPNNGGAGGGAGSFSVGFLKQERAALNVNEDDFKICNSSLRSGSADGQQQMLCFSSPSPVSSSTYYNHHTSYGLGSNGQQGGFLSGLRGPFTPSQWMELEHQALIYKYITANVPIPSYLLHPIRKAFESVGFSSFPGVRSNALGWGAFHLGFASTDPEPGRCRRTDGKKWRCSRDAVVDQKYCERHMNRGRHRSRKPVEGQSGQPATKTSGGKPTSIAASSAPGGASNGVVLSHPSGIPNINKSVADKDNADIPRQQAKGLEDNHLFSITNPHPYGESSFGLVCSDSLLNPLNRSSSLINNKSYNTSDNLPDHGNKSHHHHHHHPLRQFMDEWPENQPDRTQISIAMASDEKTAASPPRLSRELEMGLGVGPASKRTNHRQTDWVPISWEPSMGGPLGEALHTAGECNSTKPLNLIGTWDSNSPRLASSPTGVLQRGPFGSLSSSSAGSSPRAGLCNGLIGSSLMNPSLPSL